MKNELDELQEIVTEYVKKNCKNGSREKLVHDLDSLGFSITTRNVMERIYKVNRIPYIFIEVDFNSIPVRISANHITFNEESGERKFSKPVQVFVEDKLEVLNELIEIINNIKKELKWANTQESN